MANVDLYDAGDVFVSTHTTIQAAIDAASSGYKVKVGASGSPYYEALTMVSGITLMPKTGESATISGAVEELITDLNTGLWTFHETVTGRSVYRYTYTPSPIEINAVRGTDTKIYTYASYADLTAFNSGQGIYFDDAANRIYIILGTGSTNPNTVAIALNSTNYTIDLNGDDGCTIEDLTIVSGGEATIRLRNSDSTTIQRCTIKHGKHGIWLKNDGNACNNNIIQDNTIQETYDEDWTWGEVKGSGVDGTGIRQTAGGTGNIIRRNNVSGYFNGITLNRGDSGAPLLDGTLIYENVVHDIRDDAIEIEDFVRNFQIYLNEIYDAFVCFSASPHDPGPSYFYRNRCTADKDANGLGRCFKGIEGQTRKNVKIYHNTFTANGNVFPMPNDTPSEITNFEIYNNIFLVNSGKFAINGSPLHTETGNEYDGNIYYRLAGSSNLFQDFDKNNGQERADLDAFRASAEGIASGWEVNGQDDTDGNPFVDLGSYPYPMELTSASSIAINQGITLPASFPDETPYAGDTTVGWKPYDADPGIPVKATGIVRSAVNTVTGNQTFRDSQLLTTPTAAIFIMTGATADGTATNDVIYSIGFATSTTERVAICFNEVHNVATTDTDRQSIENGCVFFQNNARTIVAQADFVQFEADAGSGAGVTINWSNAPESAFLLTVILFVADSAKVGTYLTPATTNTTVSPTVGFQATLLFFIAASEAIPNNNASAIISFGAATGALVQRCIAYRSANNVAGSDINGQFINNRVSSRLQSGGTQSNGTELTAVGATTFTVTQRDGAGGTDEVGYLALDMGIANIWIGDTDIPASTGLHTFSAPTFFPQLIIMGLTNTEAANTAYTDGKGGANGISAITSYSSFCNIWHSDDAANPSVAKVISDNQAVNLPDDTGTTMAMATLSQFTSVGFQLNYTNVPGTAKKAFSVAIEGPSQEGGTVPLFAAHYSKMRRR